MLLRVSIILNALVFLIIIPYLEVSPTHVFNPDWPAHARLHEVWQLVSNGLLSIFALWLVFRSRSRALGAIIALAINLGFLTAYLSAGTYGGSMVHSDGTEILVAGVNPASAILIMLTLGILIGLMRSNRELGGKF